MKFLIILFVLFILFWGFSIPFVLRAYARTRADQVIYGHRPSTGKKINSCISCLTWSNKWITNRTEPDKRRINRLRDMLNGMQSPHG